MSTAEEKAHFCAICAYPAPSQCSGCGKAFYCSIEHQRTGWAKHKRLCKIYQRQAKGEHIPADSYCGLCGRTDGRLRKTECCNRTVCDDYEKYKMFTFSHDSCSRNHDRYTRCCYHYNEGHRGDALTCRKCNTDHDLERQAWYQTNNFNFQEDIERANPAPFTPTLCMKCNRPIKVNVEPNSFGAGGTQCEQCMDGVAGPGGNRFRLDGS